MNFFNFNKNEVREVCMNWQEMWQVLNQKPLTQTATE